MAHLNQVKHAASTAPSTSQGRKHLLTWQKGPSSSEAREGLRQQLYMSGDSVPQSPVVGQVQR